VCARARVCVCVRESECVSVCVTDVALDFDPSCNNSFAIQIYSNTHCSYKDYSPTGILTCDDCLVLFSNSPGVGCKTPKKIIFFSPV
jgi:hypothetical protein